MTILNRDAVAVIGEDYLVILEEIQCPFNGTEFTESHWYPHQEEAAPMIENVVLFHWKEHKIIRREFVYFDGDHYWADIECESCGGTHRVRFNPAEIRAKIGENRRKREENDTAAQDRLA